MIEVIKENISYQKLYKGVFWVIGNRVIKAEFGLDNNGLIRDISVKADGSGHYRCNHEEDMNG